VISAADPDAWFTHGFTYSGHPVCCAAALKNIEIIANEALLGHARISSEVTFRCGRSALSDSRTC
jgi:adenosylmethionine-8-amino-7-oxononanoate aminotransferase